MTKIERHCRAKIWDRVDEDCIMDEIRKFDGGIVKYMCACGTYFCGYLLCEYCVIWLNEDLNKRHLLEDAEVCVNFTFDLLFSSLLLG